MATFIIEAQKQAPLVMYKTADDRILIVPSDTTDAELNTFFSKI